MRHIIEIDGEWQGGSFASTDVAAALVMVKSQHPGKAVTSRVRGEVKPAAATPVATQEAQPYQSSHSKPYQASHSRK